MAYCCFEVFSLFSVPVLSVVCDSLLDSVSFLLFHVSTAVEKQWCSHYIFDCGLALCRTTEGCSLPINLYFCIMKMILLRWCTEKVCFWTKLLQRATDGDIPSQQEQWTVDNSQQGRTATCGMQARFHRRFKLRKLFWANAGQPVYIFFFYITQLSGCAATFVKRRFQKG